MIIASTLGFTALPALGQLSTLPPLHCTPDCFVPGDGVAVPDLEIIPWDSSDAATFLNNLGAEASPESPLGQMLTGLTPEVVTQVIQEGVDDPILIDSLGRILLLRAATNQDPQALQQAEEEFVNWLYTRVSFIREGSLPIDEPIIYPISELSPFDQAVAEAFNALPLDDQYAILESSQGFQNFRDSLVPETAVAQIGLSQQSQELVYRYLQRRTFDRLRSGTLNPLADSSPTLDLSGLTIRDLPNAERINSDWLVQTSGTQSSVNDAVQAGIEAYQTAHSAADLFKATEPIVLNHALPVAQGETATLPESRSPWSAFIAGDIAWGNTQTTVDFDLNNYLILAGADYRINPHITLGGAIGYSTGNQRNALATAEADGLSLNLNGTAEYGSGGYTTGFVGYGFDSYNSRRTVVIPGANRNITGASSGNQFNIGLETGWVFLEGGLVIQPSLGLRYASSRVNGYTEAGDPTVATTIDSYNTNSTIANLGIDLAYPIATGNRYIMPFVGVGLNHRLGYSAPVVTARFVGGGGSFVVPVADVDHTWFDFSAGVSADLSRNTVGQILFRTDLGRFDANIHNLSVNLRHRF